MSSSKVQTSSTTSTSDAPSSSIAVRLAIAWTVVGVPLAYGIYETAKKASALFTG
jgi:hypothetical protein